MLSDVFLARLRASRVPMYRLATKAGADPFWLSRLVSAALAVKARDERIVRLGQLVGLTVGEVFEADGQRAGFVMARKGRLNAPAIVCERCGDEITDIEMGGVVWRPSAEDGRKSSRSHDVAMPPGGPAGPADYGTTSRGSVTAAGSARAAWVAASR